jgi:excisionase family DNA binding protein
MSSSPVVDQRPKLGKMKFAAACARLQLSPAEFSAELRGWSRNPKFSVGTGIERACFIGSTNCWVAMEQPEPSQQLPIGAERPTVSAEEAAKLLGVSPDSVAESSGIEGLRLGDWNFGEDYGGPGEYSPWRFSRRAVQAKRSGQASLFASVKESAKAFRVSESTIYKLLQTGTKNNFEITGVRLTGGSVWGVPRWQLGGKRPKVGAQKALTVSEISQLLGVGKTAVYEELAMHGTVCGGAVKATKVGSSWRVERQDLEKLAGHDK